jgi:hypothetical protein
MLIDSTIFQYILLAVVLLAVFVRLLKSEGWDLKPMFYENGNFQINTVFILITGFLGAIPILETVNVIGATTISLQLIAMWTVFAGVYGTPAGIDGIGTILNQYAQSRKAPEELEEEGVA